MKNIRTSLLALFVSLISFSGFAAAADDSGASNPVSVSGLDLIQKVYGIVDSTTPESNCRQEVSERFATSPTVDEDAEWLSTEDGFTLDYEGMSPEVEAMARYDRGEVAGFGYIFYFPYQAAERHLANDSQCAFCSTLLQELADNGITLGSDTDTEALFNVKGMSENGTFTMTLNEEVTNETLSADLRPGEIPADREGQFVLLISVLPANATPALALQQ